MLAVVRLKSEIGENHAVRNTLKKLKLNKINSLAIMPDTLSVKGMLRRCESVLAWGEVDEMFAKSVENKNLHPPKYGFRSLKALYPKGDLGYRGAQIKDLIERMVS
jgi:ribosomal protein L30/L7E